MSIDKKFWKNKKVLLTGCTGFKGSWLSIWLAEMGAKVYGYSTLPPTLPSMFEILKLSTRITYQEGDLRNYSDLKNLVNKVNPEIVFHLAAQSLVKYSYANPIETYHTNVLGLVNLFEACKTSNSVKAIINVTSDKCYENREWIWGYKETDRMGGYDPYSNSKGCAELVTSCYQNSFFNPQNSASYNGILLASCRAGNVIGGGDWADNRIIPDTIKSFIANEPVQIRNPKAIRPWQHVLEPLSGYILVAQELYGGNSKFACGWNFGPDDSSHKNVEFIIRRMCELWGSQASWEQDKKIHPHEANLLKLDCSKAKVLLGWNPVWDLDRTLINTVAWYKIFINEQSKLYSLSVEHLENYMEL